MSKKLDQLTKGKDVHNYLDADLDEVSKITFTPEEIKTPKIQKDAKNLGANTLQNALNKLPARDNKHINRQEFEVKI